MVSLKDPITSIPYIGDKQAEKLERLDIRTVYDLLTHFPTKYIDNRKITKIKDLGFEDNSTICATIESINTVYTRYRKTIIKTVVRDDTGTYEITWFNQPFLNRVFKKGDQYIFQMKRSQRSGKIYCKGYERVAEDYVETGGQITPQYAQTKGLTSKWLRSRLEYLISSLGELSKNELPENILKEESLIGLNKSLKQIHYPENEGLLSKARTRLQFEELLSLQISLHKQRSLKSIKEAYQIEVDRNELLDIISNLPFTLTDDQIKAIKEIINDINKGESMNRLLNGDVGAGKTIVAILAAYLIHEEGYSTILLAPTTILAKQHFETFKKFFDQYNINVDLITSDTAIENEDDDNRIIIGTHALLYRDNLPTNTALVIVDEQHRFGVEQREKIRNDISKTHQPHYLMMTATPIPRTLTNVLYSDMQVSLIQSMPSNRKRIKSYVVENEKREDCYSWIAQHIKKTEEQAYIVFPLIEDSEAVSRLSVTTAFETFRDTHFKNINIALLHGRMKEDEKAQIMRDFAENKISILFSTSVIEVGIDVPNATVMLIESAESFGLAQLHQLRGRVGRGDVQSHCYVIPSEEIEEKELNLDRLEFFANNSSGFDIAEYDLHHRGPGEVFGTKQSGIPNLKIADLLDTEMVLKSKRNVERALEEGYVPFFEDPFHSLET